MNKKLLLIPLALILALSLIAIGCPSTPTTTPPTTKPPTTAPTTAPPTVTPPEQDEILIGASRDITGPQASFQDYGFTPIYRMWEAEVNAAGGINVAGKMLPVRIIEYDDASDPAACTRNLEKLITEDNVDFLFGPTGTAMLFAAAPIANKYETLIICGEGGATTLEPKLPDLPYVFSVLNYSNHFQIPVFAEIMDNAGAQTAYIMYMADLHGAEYNLTAQSEFTMNGIQVVGSTSIPISITDMNPIIEEAKGLNPDIFCSFAYPNQNVLFMQTALALDFSPNAILLGPGGNFGFFYSMFGPAMEDVMCEGAWNRKSSEGANELADKLVAATGGAAMGAFGDEEAFVDWWGALVYYSALQYFQQSIEQAASLDSDAVRDVMVTAHFETALGEMWWDVFGNGKGGALLPQPCYAGQIGQWQNGIFEVIDPGEKRTADPIYPKRPWPSE